MKKNVSPAEYDLIIAGLGASGGFALCALNALGVSRSVRVLAVEKSPAPFRKIAASGNGRCNYSNASIASENYYSFSASETWRKKFTSNISSCDLMDFFYKQGIPSRQDEYGRLFPYTNSSKTIISFLEREVKKSCANVVFESSVTGVNPIGGDSGFEVSVRSAGEKGNFKARTKNFICAAGGSAYPKFGTDGSFLGILRNLGHDHIEPVPGIVALEAALPAFKSLSGLKMETIISFGENFSRKGELLFTDYGISGPNVLYASCAVSMALGKGPAWLAVNFLPETYMDSQYFKKIRSTVGAGAVDIFGGTLDERFVRAFIKNIPGMPTDGRKLSDYDVEKTVTCLKNFKLQVASTRGFADAQVSLGGVVCPSVNPDTLESRFHGGLYIIGEALDFTGGCGGYNIHMAAATAFAAVKDIAWRFGKK